MAAKTRKPRTPKAGRYDPNTPAAKVIAIFGGLARYCELSGLRPSIVYGWLVRGSIPQKRWPDMIALAQANEIALSETDFLP